MADRWGKIEQIYDRFMHSGPFGSRKAEEELINALLPDALPALLAAAREGERLKEAAESVVRCRLRESAPCAQCIAILRAALAGKGGLR